MSDHLTQIKRVELDLVSTILALKISRNEEGGFSRQTAEFIIQALADCLQMMRIALHPVGSAIDAQDNNPCLGFNEPKALSEITALDDDISGCYELLSGTERLFLNESAFTPIIRQRFGSIREQLQLVRSRVKILKKLL